MYFSTVLLAGVGIEMTLLVLFLLASLAFERWGLRIPGRNSIQSGWKWLCARKRLAVALMGLLGFMGAASVGLLSRIPEPSIHDEFCYLLAADTFSNGRLANPPHPLWRHFETFHVLQSPTYSVKYFPGQGLMLALGQKLSGYPIVGVWINMGLLCAALCWMLQGWVPPGWAIFGSLIGLVRLEYAPDLYSHVGFGYWAQSYWGGGVPALGGALVYGALPRLAGPAPKLRHALLMGVGFSIMAISRPYEGICASLPAVALSTLAPEARLENLALPGCHAHRGAARTLSGLAGLLQFPGYRQSVHASILALQPHVLRGSRVVLSASPFHSSFSALEYLVAQQRLGFRCVQVDGVSPALAATSPFSG
jgi:hypothetical protein